VFPTWENYVEQFEIFCTKITQNGVLIYNAEDVEVKKMGESFGTKLNAIAYKTPTYEVTETGTLLAHGGKKYPLRIFGGHNLQNLMGAMHLAASMGIDNDQFLTAMETFTGAGKRLQKVVETSDFVLFKDFAHSPSKLKATTKAVKEQYPNRMVIACMELHTFSSLKKEFLPHYENAMEAADEAIVYFSHEVVKHKKLDPISADLVKAGFGGNVTVLTETSEVLKLIRSKNWKNSVLLMMSSGNFDGIDYDSLGNELIAK
jgi:UDP-N-acetylmuramate: L-alanyl-gamma-D-glutamyl-meso-diaminopimelate ligase